MHARPSSKEVFIAEIKSQLVGRLLVMTSKVAIPREA